MFSLIGKFLTRLIQFFCYLISFLPKRNKNIWVFGSFGDFNDNSRYLFEYVSKEHPEIRCVWISSRNKSVLLASEFGEAYSTNSLTGLSILMKAGVYIYSAYVRDICWYTSGGAYKVNLWHGIPLKKIEFDIRTPPLVNVFHNATLLDKFKHPHAHIKHDLVLSPSRYVAEYSFISAFRLPDISKVIVATYPRVQAIIKINEALKVSDKKEKVFLYTPTWRDSGSDFILSSGLNFNELNEVLFDNNAKLIIKLHPATIINYDVSSLTNISLANNSEDPSTMLAEADCLITDYSSIYFDYLVLNRPIIFFPFDKNEYLKGREFYFDYDIYTPGVKAYNARELISCIISVCHGSDPFKGIRSEVNQIFSCECEHGVDGNAIITNRVKALP
ncbi:CDP-glycerol glycerophosphotransferase family protein [Aeromonas caviae]|uniref:CDP-glycerol glycerophosphotransferase family protein n=1 Tax=Aeromonas caviae TaxID=648 RepID=UPI002B46ED96|nr:CDP-glycerol glycerophosphotransferase family protein [Aeromonas caviae]